MKPKNTCGFNESGMLLEGRYCIYEVWHRDLVRIGWLMSDRTMIGLEPGQMWGFSWCLN